MEQFEASQIPEKRIISQLEAFSKGIPHLKLRASCSPGNGIQQLPDTDRPRLLEIYAAAASDGRIMKFVPASGAATRMFESLLAIAHAYETIDRSVLFGKADEADETNADHRFVLKFVDSIEKFAFFHDLTSRLAANGVDIDARLKEESYTEILQCILNGDGLNYANRPKALIPFHRYAGHSRTPLEEHIVEAINTTQDRHRIARIHFTVAPEHRDATKDHIETIRHRYETDGIRLDIGLSVQEEATDTIAADMENRAYRTSTGKLVFRPGGHGALIENLHDLEADIVFLKNIDNVIPDHLTPVTYTYKRLIGGYLLDLQTRTFDYLDKISANGIDDPSLAEMTGFAEAKLSISIPDHFPGLSRQEKIDYLYARLNRPIRICGVVKNQGEPGGGPFWVEHADGSCSLQIVETSQIDGDLPDQAAILKNATHFNPVDIVCGLKNFRGNQFSLHEFIDPDTGSISVKSQDGRALQALELPGLWNGAMAFWNTIFVEVPLETFNPVKTVNDLLRPAHQPEDGSNED